MGRSGGRGRGGVPGPWSLSFFPCWLPCLCRACCVTGTAAAKRAHTVGAPAVALGIALRAPRVIRPGHAGRTPLSTRRRPRWSIAAFNRGDETCRAIGVAPAIKPGDLLLNLLRWVPAADLPSATRGDTLRQQQGHDVPLLYRGASDRVLWLIFMSSWAAHTCCCLSMLLFSLLWVPGRYYR